ncbi:hypothetical protein [Streptomyces sp. NPDC089919]|uniref:hypothetical protein n=1 Tax=Streptomyces sp. NPDC089919 TaxID=3155188 RepID=UPI00343CD3E5
MRTSTGPAKVLSSMPPARVLSITSSARVLSGTCRGESAEWQAQLRVHPVDF